jgi:hypothetical protein
MRKSISCLCRPFTTSLSGVDLWRPDIVLARYSRHGKPHVKKLPLTGRLTPALTRHKKNGDTTMFTLSPPSPTSLAFPRFRGGLTAARVP